MKPLIIIAGPTAVGKTEFSLALAEKLGGEIISADSMQVYRGMDIGSAKIKPEEQKGIPHYLIDVLSPFEEFHVVKFQEMAKKAMDQIYKKGHIPILAGGTGFYIQALLRDIDFTEEEGDPSYRRMLEALDADKLYHMLLSVDPEGAGEIHPNNRKRMIRALEFYHLTGGKISEHNAKQKQKSSPYQFAYFVLTMDRARLYERINLRVDQMLNEGLLEEVRALKNQGLKKEMVSMQGLGYKEIFSYLDGECSLEEAVELLKKNTRHFAKRQLTWFKREPEAIWLNKDELPTTEALLDKALSIIQEKHLLEAGKEDKN